MSDKDSTAVLRYLASLGRHLRKHHLGDTLLNIELPRWERPGNVYACRYDRTGLDLIADWLKTLRGATVSVHAFSETRDRTVHLKATGAMGDGTPTDVTVIVDGDQFDLLATNTPLTKGADVPVELLLSLVSAEAAESRDEPALAGTAVTS